MRDYLVISALAMGYCVSLRATAPSLEKTNVRRRGKWRRFARSYGLMSKNDWFKGEKYTWPRPKETTGVE
jgi:hypothetical protein